MSRPAADSQWPYRWDLLLRYRLIEIIALWEGRLTTNALMLAFGIGRQQASKDINTYIREIGPSNLLYDKQLRGYKPTPEFKAILTAGLVDEYLHLLNSRMDLASHFTMLDIKQANTEVIYSPNRLIKPEFIRPIIKAAREKKRLEIKYQSLKSKEAEYRVITPHTLVYSGYRWHVRAHCEKHNAYRDFALSRMRDIPEPVLNSENTIENDMNWNTEVTLKIVPDHRLELYQQEVIAQDYAMKRNSEAKWLLAIKTRAALAEYYLQFLRIDHKKLLKNPLEQQLILENREEISPFLF